jgi:hypothetical protein
MESDRMNLQLSIVGVVGCCASFRFGKEVIIMETFLEILREVLKGVMRELSAYFFREKVLENKKTALRRRKQKGGPVPVTA